VSEAREAGAPRSWPVYAGGRGMFVAALVGGAGLLATALLGLGGGREGARQALASYLLGFLYWVGISVCALILLGTFHAAGARWMVVLRRALELMAASVGIFVPLFLPVVLGLKLLYPWADFDSYVATLPEHAQHAMHVKHAWFSLPFFAARQVLYFGSWVVVAELQYRWSRAQDGGQAPLLTRRQRVLGAASLPLLALTLTFASVDWVMSLDPLFFSTLYGVYYFAGSFLSALAVWTVAAVRARGEGGFGLLVTAEHLHSLGKLLLGFTVFWAYIAFSQLLLTWIANLPEEVTWYILRWDGGWGRWSLLLLVAHFVLPFLLLLPRERKRSRPYLLFVCGWLLVVHAVDLYWLVMPGFRVGTAMAPRLSDVTALGGVGGIAVAFGLWRARGRYSVPVADPFLGDSLAYTQPL
jgi:hypothetical protein